MKKILLIGVILAMVLTLILPSVAMAAKPSVFTASGEMTTIDQGQTRELGESGKWLVADRHILGTFDSGDLDGDFTLTYGGVFDLATQAGNLVGTLKNGSKTILVTGKVSPYEIVDTGMGFSAPQLTIKGKWVGLKGLKANGEFTAWFIFIPDEEGHVVQIIASSFDMTGKYNPK
jgi:hypothetical protein